MNQFVRSDFYAPLMMWPRLLGDPKERPLEDRNFRNVTIKGRLKSGVSQARAQTELSVIAKDLERAYPDTNRDRDLVVRTELQTRIAQSPPDSMLIAMLTTLAFAVLFVACANVAGLLTSRAPARAREMAMRLAIGAGRARLIRQLMTESLLIALAGGVSGSCGRLRRHQTVSTNQNPDRSAGGTHLPARSPRVGVQSRRRRAERGAVRSRSGNSNFARRLDDGHEGRRVDDRAAATVGAQPSGRRTSRGLGGVAGSRHVHVSRLSAATEQRSGIPNRSLADDELRPKPRALHRRRDPPILPPARRTGTVTAWREIGRARLVCPNGH